jgi:hypothetical protein
MGCDVWGKPFLKSRLTQIVDQVEGIYADFPFRLSTPFTPFASYPTPLFSSLHTSQSIFKMRHSYSVRIFVLAVGVNTFPTLLDQL